MRSSPALAALIAGALLVAHPAFADTVSDGVAAMPGGIEDVRIGGTWDKDGSSGAYRIIVVRSGTDTVTARLFVQWIAYQADGGATVAHSIEIGELANLKADIIDYTSESGDDGLSIYLEMIDPTGKADSNYELHITSPTEYRFGPASN